MFDDFTSTDALVVAGGTVGIPVLLMYLTQAFKDFWPGLAGRWAIGVVYAESALVSAAVLEQANVAYNLEWFIALLVLTASWAEVAKALYTKFFGRELDPTKLSTEQLNSILTSVSREFERRYRASRQPVATDDA